jgi:hypothetical protein
MIKGIVNVSTTLNVVLLYDCCVRSFQNHYERLQMLWNSCLLAGGEGVRGTGISFLLEVILFGYFVPVILVLKASNFYCFLVRRPSVQQNVVSVCLPACRPSERNVCFNPKAPR